MIREVSIRNFKCYNEIAVGDLRPITIVVGENGSGKTAFLEAVFLALGRSPELVPRYRAQRGLEPNFSGSLRRIEEAIWKGLFFNGEWDRPLVIELEGDGPEARSVRVARGPAQLTIPLTGKAEGFEERAPISFTWRDYIGREHVISPKLSRNSLELDSTNEEIPDFFFFPSSQFLSAAESASRFSELSQQNRLDGLVRAFTKEYRFISDLSIEVEGGSPIIFATLRDGGLKLPLANVSSGINRVVSILAAIAVSPSTVVIVDEIENGIYYKHLPSICRMMYSFAKQAGAQLLLSTHSEEWLEALVIESDIPENDVCLLRVERHNGHAMIQHFPGDELRAGLEYGSKIR